MADRYFEVNKINVRYGDIQVLWDIEFTADKGEIVALVGSNGAGKSTTVKSCAGLIRPFQGNIHLDGHDLTGAACRTFIDHGVILVPEGRQLFPSMTIYENLEMGDTGFHGVLQHLTQKIGQDLLKASHRYNRRNGVLHNTAVGLFKGLQQVVDLLPV